jgi:hypothetical protein
MTLKVSEIDINRYINYGASPRLLNCLVEYAEDKLAPGSALTGLLENDLKKFVANADPTTLANLQLLFQFVYNVLPGDCWGSKEVVDHFLEYD